MIKRVIYLNSIEELDLNNIGVHFTSDKYYRHSGGGSNGLTEVKKIEVVICIDRVSKNKINEKATAISNANYPSEKEVVLEMNTEFSAWVLGKKVKINTGTRADLWVKNLK